MLPDADFPAKILGYYTLSSYAVYLDTIPTELRKKLPRYPEVPAALIGRLAIDHRSHGRGLGKHLLLDAMKKVVTHAATLGTVMLLVDAKDDEAAAYYKQFGFIPLPSEPHRLFMLVETMAQLFA